MTELQKMGEHSNLLRCLSDASKKASPDNCYLNPEIGKALHFDSYQFLTKFIENSNNEKNKKWKDLMTTVKREETKQTV
jgi:hypothetical protein